MRWAIFAISITLLLCGYAAHADPENCIPPVPVVSNEVNADSRNYGPIEDSLLKAPGHGSVVFSGLFKNPDYSHPQLFLNQDEQTLRTPEVEKIAAQVNNKQELSTLEQIFAAVHKMAPFGRPSGSSIFTTTATQVLTRGFATGCTDYAIAFATLARAKGIPAIIVDSADKDWIRKGALLNQVSGHFYVEVLLQGKWQLVDSTTGKLYVNYDPKNRCLPGGRIAFAKALSVIDMGVGETTHNLLQRTAFVDDKTPYVDPGYSSINLNSPELHQINIPRSSKNPHSGESCNAPGNIPGTWKQVPSGLRCTSR